MDFVKQAVLAAFLLLISSLCRGQISIQKSGIMHRFKVDETTPITDAKTGQRISFKQYNERIKDDLYGWHLMPDYDEYGKPMAFTLRPTTAEERDTHQFRDIDTTKQPKVGQPIAPFVMTGLDDKVYRSTDLTGNVVVLSFWISLDKPFWGPKQADEFANVLRPYRSETGPIVLGILNSDQPKIVEHLDNKTLPFMPVPNSYGFHRRYQINTVPTFIVIDKRGDVAAYIEGAGNYDKLKQALARVTK